MPVEPVGRPGSLLGSFGEVDLSEDTVRLSAGDALVLYTDGVIERHDEGRFFGQRRLRELLAGLADQPAQAIADAVERAVVEFQADSPRDDLAILVVKPR
jgi:serine phosphatase RsbU (regulator of sigma subunit)